MIREFEKWIEVTEPECDLTHRMSLSNIMRHTQQMGSDHIAREGITYERMQRDGMVFLVNKMLITIKRRPIYAERLRLITVPRAPKGAQFIRDTYFDTKQGERLVETSISWILADPRTHRILRPAAFDIYGLEMFPNDGEYITAYRIKKPDAAGVRHMRQIKYSDLDSNSHVNNAVYADIVCDTLPLDWLVEREIERFGIVYQKEAVTGQVIELDTVQISQCAYYVGGMVGDGRCFEAEINFTEKLQSP